MQQLHKMDTIVINSENDKNSDTDKLILNLKNKKHLKEEWQICCLIKSWHLIYIEKIKNSN